MRFIRQNIKQIISFGIVGLVNTVVGTVVMFSMYNWFGFGYWISSGANYIVGSICSYLLNKKFTFKVRETNVWQIIRFAVNISVCYLLAYGCARNVAYRILKSRNISIKFIENISMLIGMVLFVLLNYIGQKYLVFKNKKIN